MQHCHSHTLETTTIFAPHHIYNCIKGTYSKQIIISERKEAILLALEDFVKRGLLEDVGYNKCTTRHFKINGENYLKIMEWFDKINTKTEENERITPQELHDALLPYYVDPKDDEPKEKSKPDPDPLPNGYEWMEPLMGETGNNKVDYPTEWIPLVSQDVYREGLRISTQIEKERELITPENKDEMLYTFMTPAACQFINLWEFHQLLDTYYFRN